MHKFTLPFLAAVLAASTAHAESPSPPNSLVLITCRSVQVTEFPPGVVPIPGKTYYELYINKNQEYECQRVRLDLVDEVAFNNPYIPQLDPDWSQYAQCSRMAMMKSAEWDEKHPGWLTVAAGCPTPIGWDSDNDGKPDRNEKGEFIVKDWKMPECPAFLPGTKNRMKCRFTESEI